MSVKKITAVYEAIDATDDEAYYTLGIWLDLDSAKAAINRCDPDDLDDFDSKDYGFYRVEIVERPIGFGDRKTVCTFEWTKAYNEALDEFKWKRIDRTGAMK